MQRLIKRPRTQTALAYQPILCRFAKHQKSRAKRSCTIRINRPMPRRFVEFWPILITSCVVEQADIDLASLNKSSALKGNTLIAKQALDEAIAKHGRRMADTENYPASRNVVEIDLWRSEFLKMRIDSGAQEASVAKDFTRQSKQLQESGVVHGYSGMVWFVHEEDRQDI